MTCSAVVPTSVGMTVARTCVVGTSATSIARLLHDRVKIRDMKKIDRKESKEQIKHTGLSMITADGRANMPHEGGHVK